MGYCATVNTNAIVVPAKNNGSSFAIKVDETPAEIFNDSIHKPL